MKFDLDKKSFILTGSKGYLGEIIKEHLVSEGAYVCGIDTCGDNVVDICDFEVVKSFIYKHHIEFDGIINCAAVSFKGKNITQKQFSKTLDVNITGANNVIKACEDVLVEDASIVNISSIYGSLSPDFEIYKGNESLYNSSAYGASKAALNQLTKYYSVQMAPIRVNSISPGGIFQNHSKFFIDNYSKKVPLKRMADPKEISNVVLFLLSSFSSYITGQNIVVDGGMSAL